MHSVLRPAGAGSGTGYDAPPWPFDSFDRLRDRMLTYLGEQLAEGGDEGFQIGVGVGFLAVKLGF